MQAVYDGCIPVIFRQGLLIEAILILSRGCTAFFIRLREFADVADQIGGGPLLREQQGEIVSEPSLCNHDNIKGTAEMKWIVAALTIVLICLPTSAESNLNAEDSKEIDRLTRAIATDPTDRVYAERGRLYEKNEMFQKAELDYSEAIKLAPNEPQWLWRRGMALAEEERFEEALADCAKTLKLAEKGDLNYTQALRIRTHCFEMLHREQDMLADLRQLAALGDSTAAAAVQRWEEDHKTRIKEQLDEKQIPQAVSQWEDAKAPPWPAIEKIAAAMDNDEPRLGPMHVRASVALILIREFPEQLKSFRDDPINMAMKPENGPELLAAYLGYVKRCLIADQAPVFLKPVYWAEIQKLWKEGRTNDALALSYHPELGQEQIEGVRRYMDQIKDKK